MPTKDAVRLLAMAVLMTVAAIAVVWMALWLADAVITGPVPRV